MLLICISGILEMDICSFGVHFTDEESCPFISRNIGIRMGLFATAVGQQTIIGSKTNGATNDSPAGVGYPCAVAQSWKVPSCPLWPVTRPFFYCAQRKRDFPIRKIQRQLWLKHYEPVWAMIHKLMVKLKGSADISRQKFWVISSLRGPTIP